MSDLPTLLNSFESLGDNCEFGFVQRKFGTEPAGLLRWAIASPAALVAGLQDEFAHLYAYDKLVSNAVDMLGDLTYGISFHTNMRSSRVDGQFRFNVAEPERHQIYLEELKKINYLKNKLLEKLKNNGTIFVYKRNAGVSSAQAFEIRDQLLNYNPQNVLLVVGTEGDTPGKVWEVAPNLLRATIDRFAPYNQADDVSYDLWLEICQKTHAILQAKSAAALS
jgi:hypothetical protein